MTFLLYCVVTCGAQEEQPKPSVEVQSLIDAAPAAPPELAADILLKLVDHKQIPAPAQRLEMIERAFQMAGQAKFPFLQTAAVGRAFHTDSGPGIRMAALGSGLSTLDLRCRTVRSALAMDKVKALELFRQVTVGPFPALSCDDALVPSIELYYQTLREVALSAYSPRDRAEGRHIELIETAVRGMTIPQQLEPVAMLLANFPLTQERRAELVGMYATGLKQMTADARSFGATRVGLGLSVVGLARVLNNEGMSTVALVDAFRTYLVRHLRAATCAETVDAKDGALYMRQMVDKFFNQALLTPSGATDIAPLTFEELKPASVEGPAKFSDFWREGRSREIMARYKALRFGSAEQQQEYQKRERRKDGMAHFLPEELRRAPEWEAQAREFLNELERWRRNHDEPEADFFHEICIQYMALLDIIPAGPLHQTVLDTYVAFLKTSPMERESPPEWLLHVLRLFSITDASPEQLDRVREAARKSGNLTMSLYAELARLNPKQRRN